MTRAAIILTTILTLMIDAALAGNAFEIKNVYVGMSRDDFKKVSEICGDRDECVNTDAYKPFDTIAGEEPKYWTIKFVNDKIDTILVGLNQPSFVPIRNALIKKFGKPRSTSEEIVGNKFGARFKRSISTWSHSGNSMLLMSHSVDLDSATLMIVSARANKESDSATARKGNDL